MDACPVGQEIQDRKKRSVIGCKNSGVAQYQGGGSGRGRKDMEGDKKISALQLEKVRQGYLRHNNSGRA